MIHREPTTRSAKLSVIQSLAEVEVDSTVAREDCAVCQDSFTLGEKGVVRMPCDHYFHRACLRPWLRSHNTCPTCRYELDTQDEAYNHKLREGRAKAIDMREVRCGGESKTSDLCAAICLMLACLL